MMQRYVKTLRIPAKMHLVFFFWHLNGQSSPGSLHLHANAADEVHIIFPTKKKKTITNLNILLYQTNLDYRCNHQSSKTRTKKSPCYSSKVHYYHSKNKFTHKYIAGEKQSLQRNVLLFFLFIVDKVTIVGNWVTNGCCCGWLIS